MNRTPPKPPRKDPPRLAIALAYAKLGWRVFPLQSVRDGVCTCHKGRDCSYPGKHPRTKHGFHAGTTDETQIREWWTKCPSANIGIATGEASGIFVIDIDPRHGGDKSFAELVRQLGEFPPGPVVKTGDGWHHFFKWPGFKVSNRTDRAPGIDIKGDGGYVVAAGSIHSSGKIYSWEVSPDEAQVPTLPEPWLTWLISKGCNTEGAESAEASVLPVAPVSAVAPVAPVFAEVPRIDTKAHEDTPPSPLLLNDSVVDSIRNAIQKTYAKGPGQRHSGIFKFVRRLKAIPEVADLDADSLRPWVEEWFKMTLPNTKDKDIEITMQDFRFGWEECRYCHGAGIREVFERVQTIEPPASAVQKYGRKSRKSQLVILCRELQILVGDDTFFLSGATVGELLKVSPVHGWRWLEQLQRDKFLLRIHKGGLGKGASEYRYIATE